MISYKRAKEAFIDQIDVNKYIELPGSMRAYKELENSLDRPFKMMLLYGKPGTGKSLLLKRLYEKKKYQKEIYFIESPLLTQEEFFRRLFGILIQKPMPPNTKVDFNTFVEYCKVIKGQRDIVILIDETQLYPEEILEEIRLLSDTGVLKFIISVHKTSDEEVIAKEHFKTRIMGTVVLKNATKSELKKYIHDKLLQENQFEIANIIKEKHISKIYQFTKGNFRECNNLMYTIFDIYDYYDRKNPSKIDKNRFSMKIIEMAAIGLGYIDV